VALEELRVMRACNGVSAISRSGCAGFALGDAVRMDSKFAGVPLLEMSDTGRRDFDVDVDTVEERAGDAVGRLESFGCSGTRALVPK